MNQDQNGCSYQQEYTMFGNRIPVVSAFVGQLNMLFIKSTSLVIKSLKFSYTLLELVSPVFVALEEVERSTAGAQ